LAELIQFEELDLVVVPVTKKCLELILVDEVLEVDRALKLHHFVSKSFIVENDSFVKGDESHHFPRRHLTDLADPRFHFQIQYIIGPLL
jgi:hypothetical protein